MFSSASPLSRAPDALAWTAGGAALHAPPLREEATEFRQLRHHTKNALQRLLCEVARAGDTQTDWRQRRLLADLERRLLLSARVSDAMFGFTSQPAPLLQRLTSLADATTALMGSADQTIEVKVSVTGTPEPACLPVMIRIAHEMLGNAVKHGFRDRMIGRIEVHVTVDDRGLRMVVADDGWGPCAGADEGSGLSMMRELAQTIGGTIALTRQGDQTSATLNVRRAQRSLGRLR